ncbi:hypothetical protein D1AOALGA4SA_11048 [Olavius algarvensis Delta 1 endosymbiont]|nr:hypothetical protein D1AOALGA4SA_11048 [Olavius algarvensis Delta 1 endosymbiont]
MSGISKRPRLVGSLLLIKIDFFLPVLTFIFVLLTAQGSEFTLMKLRLY